MVRGWGSTVTNFVTLVRPPFLSSTYTNINIECRLFTSLPFGNRVVIMALEEKTYKFLRVEVSGSFPFVISSR